MAGMNNQAAIFLCASIFLFCTSNALMLEFYVSNEFVSGNAILLKMTSRAAKDHKEGEVPYGESLAWSYPIAEDKLHVKCLCFVTELEETSSSSYGYFEAFSNAVVDLDFHNLPGSMTLKWIVNEVGAALFKETINLYEMILPWPVMILEFNVTCNFADEQIRLSIINGRNIFVKRSVVPYGRHLYWTHRSRGYRHRLLYNCQVAKFPRLKQRIEVIGTFEIFNLQWLPAYQYDKSQTLSYEWRVNKEGAERMDPMTGKYEMEHRWRQK